MGNNQKTIITISRQFGSGGRDIGELLAKSMGIPFYDKELITLAAKKSGITENIFEKADQQAPNSLLYSMSMGMYSTVGALDGLSTLPLNDRVFLAQHHVIREIAQNNSCVIVGRCADYVLRDDPNVINVFIHCNLAKRIERVLKEGRIPTEHAQNAVVKADKRRAAYYEYYTGLRWGNLENYDLSLNSVQLCEKDAAQLIQHYAEMRKK